MVFILVDNFYFQLSFLANALKHPDVFCLADHKGELPTVDIDKLKSAPNEDDREISGWYGFSSL